MDMQIIVINMPVTLINIQIILIELINIQIT